MKTTVILGLFLVFCLIRFSQQFDFDYKNIAISEAFASKVREYAEQSGSKNFSKCHLHMLYYVEQLLSSNLSATMWAKKMFDSGTKIPSGILNGHLADFGTYDQCMDIFTKIYQEDVYGKYCLGTAPLKFPAKKSLTNLKNIVTPMKSQTRAITPEGQVGVMFATCLPNSCSTEEIQDMYNFFGLSPVNINFFDIFCQSKPTLPEFDAGDITVITFLSVVFAIMILSTIYDVFLYYADKKSAHMLLIAFSILENGKKLIKVTSTSKYYISCLHGIRVLSMMWIILSHRYAQSLFFPLQNSFEIVKWMNREYNMYLLGATVSVDTFLVLSGLVVAYGFMSLTKGRKFNVGFFYIHRYLRLTPVLLVVMLIYLTIFKHLGDGPMWPYVAESHKNECKDSWWSSLLYIQNYLTNPICIGQSWYLSVDFQLYVLSPLILLPLRQWPRVGYCIVALLTLLTILASFLIAWFNNLAGHVLKNTNPDYWRLYYGATHTRAGPWLIGIALGYYIYQIKAHRRKIILKKIFVLILWALSIATLLSCVFTGHNLLTEEYDRYENSLYIAFLRPAWALALAVVILLCVLDYGGPINWFLSMSLFQVLSKLTYSMYLIHMAMQMIVYTQSRTLLYLTDLTMWYGFWGDYMFTLGASVLFTLAFESPIIVIEKFLFENRKEKDGITLENGGNC